MITKWSRWRTAGPLLAIALLSSPLLCSSLWAEAKTSSLSGTVYLDYNQSGVLDNSDYYIRNAKVTLLLSSDPNFRLVATTDDHGWYFFGDIPLPSLDSTGTFTLALDADPTTPVLDAYTATDGVDNLGAVVNAGGQTAQGSVAGQAHNTPGDAHNDSFTGIKLVANSQGINYNFGKFSFPLELFNPRMLSYQPAPEQAPEPSSLVFLLMAVSTLMGWIWCPRRSA